MEQYILMSDVIKSGEKDQQLLINNLRLCTTHINEKYRDIILSPLTITLGDEFQGIMDNFESSIKVILDIEEFIIKNNFPLKLRYVVYLGDIETDINNYIAYEMLGKGLTQARSILNSLKDKDVRFHVDVQDSPKNNIVNNSFNIYQNIVDQWKINRDYELISALIEFNDYKIVSEKLHKDRSLVWKRNRNLNMSSYHSVKEVLYTISKFEHEYQL